MLGALPTRASAAVLRTTNAPQQPATPALLLPQLLQQVLKGAQGVEGVEATMFQARALPRACSLPCRRCQWAPSRLPPLRTAVYPLP